MKHWGAMKLVGRSHESEESGATEDILLWLMGSPGSTPQQSHVLTVGTAHKSACYRSSEVMGGGHIWPGVFCGEETWEAGNGFSLWQCRLFPNQLDLATWGELILLGYAPFSKASLSLSITFLATKHRESVYRCSQQCRPVFPGLLAGPSWPGTQVATAAGAAGEL